MKSMLKRRQRQQRRVRRLMFLQLLKRVRNSLRLLKEKLDRMKTRQPKRKFPVSIPKKSMQRMNQMTTTLI